MAAIPRELIESELFGHERGAFTGAVQRSAGKFEQASGGTLFLDEIGDMPPEAQTRLLRVLQEGEYTTVGGRTPIKANVRIVAATHRDLRRLIQQGLFREDLFYRLNVVPIRLPPLRERLDDIPELANHYLQAATADGLPAKVLSPEAMARLKQHRWPGNVRELVNLVRRLSALYSEEVINLETIENAEQHPGKVSSFGCPDCGGVLWEIQDGDFVRYRCRVGHAWTSEALLGKQTDSFDDALWTAIRALEESASLSRQIASRHQARGAATLASRFEEQAQRAEHRAAVIRDSLLEHRNAPTRSSSEPDKVEREA